jgi:hypothetical protein
LSKASPGASSMVPPKRQKVFRPLDGEELAVAAGDEEHEIREGQVLDEPGREGVPARWLTPTSGRPRPAARPLANMTPASTPPIRPRPGRDGDGVEVREGELARESASAVTMSSRSACARAAISGTTPPKPSCSAR